jgi:hypothetical protein
LSNKKRSRRFRSAATSSAPVPLDISSHCKQFDLANSAIGFCPTGKPMIELPSDEIFQLSFVADKRLVTKAKIAWTD